MNETRHVWGLVFVSALIALVFYNRILRPTYRHMEQRRDRAAQSHSEEDLHVAIVWPRAATSFLNGARLAAEEINERGGVQLVRPDGSRYQRKLQLREFDEPASPAGSAALSRSIAFKKDIVAVAGHSSDGALPASIVYNNSGILFIAPNSTNRAVTVHDFEFVFRIAPRDNQIAQAMVQVVPQITGQKQIRLALLYPQLLATQSGPELVRLLTDRVRKLIPENNADISFEVVITQQYERGQEDFRSVVEPLMESDTTFNLILIADVYPDAGNLRRDLMANLDAIGLDETAILDLDKLDWSREDGYYFSFTPGLAADFFDVVGRLVLRQAKQRAAVLIARDDRVSRHQFGHRLGALLESHILNSENQLHQLDLVTSKSYDPSGTDMALAVAEVLARPVEVVFVADDGESAVALIRRLREAGVKQPIVCGFGLESLLPRGGDPSLGKTYVASTFNPHSDRAPVRSFVRKYRARYPGTPGDSVDADAASGYFSIQLVKQAVERAGSSSPHKMSEALSLFVQPDGILGNNRFSNLGDLQGLQFVFKQRDHDGHLQIVTLPPPPTTKQIPYRRPKPVYGER